MGVYGKPQGFGGLQSGKQKLKVNNNNIQSLYNRLTYNGNKIYNGNKRNPL